MAVVYGALARICRSAHSAEGDAWYTRWKDFSRLYREQVSGLNPTVSDSLRGHALSIGLERR